MTILYILAAVLQLPAIVLSAIGGIKKNEKGKLNTYLKWGIISEIASIIVLLISTIIGNNINNKTTENNKNDIINVVDSGYSNLLNSIKIEDREIQEHFKGYSYHFVMILYETNNGTNKFIHDFGEENKSRHSIFIDRENNLCFRIIDKSSTPYVVKIKKSSNKFRFNELMYYCFEFGYSEEYSFLKILINGKEVAKNRYDYKIDFPESGECKAFLGCNLSKKEGGYFSLSEIMIYNATQTKNEKEQILNYLKNKSNPLKDYSKFLHFRGKGSGEYKHFEYSSGITNDTIPPLWN